MKVKIKLKIQATTLMSSTLQFKIILKVIYQYLKQT